MKRFNGTKTAGRICDLAALDIRTHGRVLVRQRKAKPRDPHRQRLICVKGVEPNTGTTLSIANVSSEIQLEKIRKTGHAWEGEGSHTTHKKRNDANPAPFREGVNVQACGQGPLNCLRFNRPMQKQQM